MKEVKTDRAYMRLTPSLKSTLNKLSELRGEPKNKVLESLLIEESMRYGLLETRKVR